MKTVLVLSVLLCAALAAPAEDKAKAPEAAVEAPEEQVVAAAPEMTKDKEVFVPEDAVPVPMNVVEGNVMMTEDEEVFVPDDAVPVPRNARVLEEEAAPESRFNFCPAGWFSHDSRCFKFINSAMTWWSAEEHCNSLGAHLASVTSSKEYIFLQQIMPTGQTVAWLGGFNLQGRWMWIDREGFYYTNWYGQSSSSSHLCTYLRTTNGWGNTVCSSSYRFICSKNPFSC